MTDWKAVEQRQRDETEPEHGYPLLVGDARMSIRRFRTQDIPRTDAMATLIGKGRPGALTADEVIDLFAEEWPTNSEGEES